MVGFLKKKGLKKKHFGWQSWEDECAVTLLQCQPKCSLIQRLYTMHKRTEARPFQWNFQMISLKIYSIHDEQIKLSFYTWLQNTLKRRRKKENYLGKLKDWDYWPKEEALIRRYMCKNTNKCNNWGIGTETQLVMENSPDWSMRLISWKCNQCVALNRVGKTANPQGFTQHCARSAQRQDISWATIKLNFSFPLKNLSWQIKNMNVFKMIMVSPRCRKSIYLYRKDLYRSCDNMVWNHIRQTRALH